MLRITLFFVLFVMSSAALAGEGYEQWQISSEEEKQELLKSYREWFADVAENDDLTHDEWEEQSSFWRSIISEAWAAQQFNCSYGGWPSVKLANGCGIPSRMNPDYPRDACPAGQMACQPLLFGNDLCAPVSTRTERRAIFENCESAATAAGHTDENILASIRSSGNETQLQSLLDFADSVCASGVATAKDPCDRLTQKIARLRAQSVGRVLSSVSSSGDALTGCGHSDEHVTPTPDPNVDYSLLTPQGLISATLGEPLQYVGKVLFSGSEEQKSCVFQNSQVYIVYNYCSDDGSEGGALGMKVFSRTGGMIEYYVENSEEKGLVSQTNRSQYDRTWRTSYIPTPAIQNNITPQELSSLYDGERNFRNGYCNAGGMMNIPQGFNVGIDTTSCRDIPSEVSDAWLPAARAFLEEPGPKWYELQQTMRAQVQGRR